MSPESLAGCHQNPWPDVTRICNYITCLILIPLSGWGEALFNALSLHSSFLIYSPFWGWFAFSYNSMYHKNTRSRKFCNYLLGVTLRSGKPIRVIKRLNRKVESVFRRGQNALACLVLKTIANIRVTSRSAFALLRGACFVPI